MVKANFVIPAAGEATRLRPLTSGSSKAMVRVNGKPVISYIIEEIVRHTDDEYLEIVIVDGRFTDIREYVERTYPNLRVRFVQQPELNGPRDAIVLGINELEDRSLPLVVWLGDAIVLEDELPIGKNFLLTTYVEDQKPWCIWDGTEFHDKPDEPIDGNALVGVYGFRSTHDAGTSFNYPKVRYEISGALRVYTACYSPFDNVFTREWYDVGEVSTYRRTCAALLRKRTRSFNDIEYVPDLNVLVKTSTDGSDDIAAEKNWYESMNSYRRMFTPRLLDTNGEDNRLAMSYESGSTMSDVFLYEDVSETTGIYLLGKILRIMRTYFHTSVPLTHRHAARRIWVDKTLERVWRTKLELDVCQSIVGMSKGLYERAEFVETMHGDLHLGNVLYDAYSDRVTFIDPRGRYGGLVFSGGDSLYDLCKLSHDVYHGYGEIVSGARYPEYLRGVFIDLVAEYYPEYDAGDVIDGGALLLATCIPLHQDNTERQRLMEERVTEYMNDRRNGRV